MTTIPRILLVATALFSAARAAAADPECQVNVNVSMTDAGRKHARPTPRDPAYYFPIVGGFREEGAISPGEKTPAPANEISRWFEKALAEQGYLRVSDAHRTPSLVLFFFWGYMNPETDLLAGQVLNYKDMLALVGGRKIDDRKFIDHDAMIADADDDRYFAMVTAYDAVDFKQRKKNAPLWVARMSTSSRGVMLADVLPAMITSGAPMFGREMALPTWVAAPIGEGNVKIGTPTVVEDSDEAQPKPKTPPSNNPKSGR